MKSITLDSFPFLNKNLETTSIRNSGLLLCEMVWTLLAFGTILSQLLQWYSFLDSTHNVSGSNTWFRHSYTELFTPSMLIEISMKSSLFVEIVLQEPQVIFCSIWPIICRFRRHLVLSTFSFSSLFSGSSSDSSLSSNILANSLASYCWNPRKKGGRVDLNVLGTKYYRWLYKMFSPS